MSRQGIYRVIVVHMLMRKKGVICSRLEDV